MQKGLLCVLVTGGLAAALYLNSIPGEFVFDDHEAIETNRDVRSDTSLSEVFSNDFWGFPLSSPESHKSYRPLTILTFRWNRLLHGMWSPGFHVVNVLLHTLVTSLYTYACCCAGTGYVVAVVAGVLFASHPIHTEAVANIVGRTELLSALFFLLSLLTYIRLTSSHKYHHPHPSHPSPSTPPLLPSLLWFSLTLVLAVLSLLCKEQGVTVLAVCVAYDILINSKMDITDLLVVSQRILLFKPSPISCKSLIKSSLGGRSSASVLKRSILLVISALVILFYRLYLGKGSPMFVESDNPASFSDHRLTRGLTYAYLCALNMWLLLFPSRLCFDWSMGSIPLVETWGDGRNLCTLALVLFAGAVLTRTGFSWQWKNQTTMETSCHTNGTNNNNNNNNNNNAVTSSPPLINTYVKTKKPHPPIKLSSNHSNPSPTDPSKKQLVLFAVALTVLPYLPAANLLFPVGFVLAERVLYLPSMGACLLVAVAMEQLAHKSEVLKRAILLLLVVMVTAYSVKTVQRNHEWTDIKLLSESAVRVNPANAKVYATLANYYAQKGYRKCEIFYREALRLRPHYATAWTNLGLVLLNTDRPKEAEESYQNALAIKWDHINANTNMGHLCRLQGRWPEAKEHYERVLSRRPESPLVLYNLGVVLESIGTPEDIRAAEEVWRKALVLVPGYVDVMLALARLLSSTTASGKRLREDSFSGGKRLEQAIHLYQRLGGSDNAEVHYELGRILLHKGQLREAEEQLQLALTRSPSHAKARLELGTLYMEAGKKEEAGRQYEQALELDPSLKLPRKHSPNQVKDIS